MKQKMLFAISIVLLAGWSVRMNIGRANSVEDQDAQKAGKELLLEVNRAISAGRFEDAHVLAGKLISEHAGDYQISLYLHVYVHSFYLLDEEFRKGTLAPTPVGILKRIEELKRKNEHTVVDLVVLASLANGVEGGYSEEYLRQIVKKFPNSPWKNWAEWILIQETVIRQAEEKYASKGPEEKGRIMMLELYGAAGDFLKMYPATHLAPDLTTAMGNWFHWGHDVLDKGQKDLVSNIYRRVLRDYPSAEYCCATARRGLRKLLGSEYAEPEGCSELQDKTITSFYCHAPEQTKYQVHTKEYLNIVQKIEGQSKIGAEGKQAATNSEQPIKKLSAQEQPANILSTGRNESRSVLLLVLVAFGTVVIIGVLVSMKAKKNRSLK